MKYRHTLILAIILLSFLSQAWGAQQKGLEITMYNDISISAPPGWQMGNQTTYSTQLYIPLQKERDLPSAEDDKNPKPRFVVRSEAGMLITIERRRDHTDAVKRLSEIVSEQKEDVSSLIIAGWPAIERRYRYFLPQTGEQGRSSGNVETWFTTTAVAVDSILVRFDTTFAPDADTKLIDESLAIGRALRAPKGPEEISRDELKKIHRLSPPQGKAPLDSESPVQTAEPGKGDEPAVNSNKTAGVAVQVHTGVGEVEVASNDGQNIVVAANSGYSYSSNFGATWTFGGGTPCNQTLCDGDPSLAVGNSGAIYYSWIGGPTNTTLGDGVSRSTNNGQTFQFRGMAATCPGTTNCQVADQEHIAADRNNAAAAGGDRVYNVWRDFAPVFSLRISCSSDGGATWTSGSAIGAGDFPRVSVGGDGFVYVAWASGGNMMLHKYSACDAGLTPQVGWPVTVSAFTNVVCPVPGLDRCNGRNILSSPVVAVDDLDPTHIYYTFATSTGAGNENVMVFDSTDGGATFPRSVRVNNLVNARRFMPWISTYGGIAAVSWYDRRNATAANNDLTRFFIGGAVVRGPNLVALTETDLSGNDDTQCSTWPCATNATTDSESCSVQPQNGGRCYVSVTPTLVGSATPCDFSTPACPPGPPAEMCFFGRGCPKYGDYNGNATGAGRVYSAWASAVPPASVGGAGGAIRVYASADRIPSDFYVRDWNGSPNFDNGQQPSTNPVFWTTSDIWNQSAAVPAAPGPDGSVLGDPPSRSGSNYVYARVFRRAAAMATAPDAPVTVNFFLGDFGIGAPFAAIGSKSVTFTAGDVTQTTPAHSWSVPVTASLHLCLAAQIDGPDGDTSALPSIVGTAPGPADPLILIDNNKAQRNLQDTIGTAEGTELMAMIRNAEAEKRVMRLRVILPPGVSIDGNFDIIGGKTLEVGQETRIEIGALEPGELRWLRFRATSLAGLDTPTPIHVMEDTDPPANGYTILLHRDTLENVARRNLTNFGGVLSRLGEIEKNTSAQEQGKLALSVAEKVSKEAYAKYLVSNLEAIGEILKKHIDAAGADDQFRIKAAADDLWRALEEKNIERAATANTALIERLDADLTDLMVNKDRQPLQIDTTPDWWWYSVIVALILVFFLVVWRRRSN